jgi:hypothetical protein
MTRPLFDLLADAEARRAKHRRDLTQLRIREATKQSDAAKRQRRSRARRKAVLRQS